MITKEEALHWFWVGFSSTGEGCNGEYTRRSFDAKEFEKDYFEQEWQRLQDEAANGVYR